MSVRRFIDFSIRLAVVRRFRYEQHGDFPPLGGRAQQMIPLLFDLQGEQ
jgi:hypothetical protein